MNLVPVLFFASGATALVYEVLWSRYLSLLFGSTVQAQTVVLAVFMGGLLGTAPRPGLPSPGPTASVGEWRSLFDGRTPNGWRGFGQPAFPDKGWIIEDGILKKVAGVRGGDLVSVETFDDFELEWEWRIPPRANNGVKYFILEERGAPIGHEYQMIDNAEAPEAKHQTASFYDVLPPQTGLPAPRLSDWNTSRILVRGQHVEHWLNGVLALTYETGSPEVLSAVARSKFKDVAGFGTKVRARLLLTDHNDEAWFRNIRVRTPQPRPAARPRRER